MNRILIIYNTTKRLIDRLIVNLQRLNERNKQKDIHRRLNTRLINIFSDMRQNHFLVLASMDTPGCIVLVNKHSHSTIKFIGLNECALIQLTRKAFNIKTFLTIKVAAFLKPFSVKLFNRKQETRETLACKIGKIFQVLLFVYCYLLYLLCGI